jgi:hypothetical protein
MRRLPSSTARWLALTALAGAGSCEKSPPEHRPIATERAPGPREALLARANSLELETPYVPPPGNPLEHYAAAFAKTVCSAVFISGFTPELAVEALGFPTCPSEPRAKLGDPIVDRVARAVKVRLPSGMMRTALYLDSQGCVTLPVGQSSVGFKPVRVQSRSSNASAQPWPLGDVLPRDSIPAEVDAAKVKAAVELAFAPPEASTAAFVVIWRGRLIEERYASGVHVDTKLYLQNGVYAGQRLLSEDYVRFASTVAPAWNEDGRPVYGGFFWINGNGQLPVPKDAYYMSGAGEQMTLIVPSHDLVVVRLGHDRGEKAARPALKRALALLLEAVPRKP